MKTILSSADIGMIGGADGPTVVMVASTELPWLLPLAVLLLLTLAYCLMRRAAKKRARSTTELPEAYREIYTVDLQKNKKMALLVNGIGVVILIAMVLPAAFLVPISTLFSMEQGFLAYTLRFLALIVGSILYIILHELTHAAVMRIYGAKKVRFGFTGMYAFAGSEQDYFDKFSYVQIALAPLLVWGLILAVINLLVPLEWFWVVYFIQISNVSGAAGDLFVSARFCKMPSDILVRDTGVSMTVYSKE
ncbi:MAG: DUF3267 domain-containing protein [Clostridia bacterium]|nr:DUF3267 domain-containing protein [Clostridia bacterium]